MPIECRQTTQGGKANLGKFIERDPNVVAAGLPTAQHNENVKDSLQHYLLKDEVDALISDAIIPPGAPQPLPPLRKPIPLDMRHAGKFGDVANLINPPILSKFQTLVNDLKDTVYKSYWHTPLASGPDPVPMLPEGFDIYGTTFGKSTKSHERLYDIVMPIDPIPDKTPPSKEAAAQTNRNYCRPAFNPELTYGYRSNIDKRGRLAKCCLTDDRITVGKGAQAVITSLQSNFMDSKTSRIGKNLAPYNNISEVPEGYSFGTISRPDSVQECLVFCKINKGREFNKKCIKHLNTLRKSLSKVYLPTFFYKFYLLLKFEDKDRSGWISKDIVYRHCGTRRIRFDPHLLEPLLSMWKAFNGAKIHYRTFVDILNFRNPLPDMPQIPEFEEPCLDYRTTYTEIVKPGQKVDTRLMAGLPSGRYLDLDYPTTPENCIRADRTYLSHESDMKMSIVPSILTHYFVDHRDMYEKQEPDVVRRVFEASGEVFSDDSFNTIWEKAKKYHSQGWVCYETFRRALEEKTGTS